MKEVNYLSRMSYERGEDEKYTIVELYTQIDYVLIYRYTRFQPWIAAWQYNPATETWQQGHYFDSCLDAVSYINELLQKKGGHPV